MSCGGLEPGSSSGVVGVSVIIPTRNRHHHVIKLVHDLLQQTHSPVEILIVDQSDEVNDALEKVGSARPDFIRIERVSFRNVSRARNFGWQCAKFDTLVFLDDDMGCSPDLISQHVKALSTSNAAMVAGGIAEKFRSLDVSKDIGVYKYWTATATRGFGYSGQKWVDHVPGANFAVRRETIAAFQGFDEELGQGVALYEETDLPLRMRSAGLNVFFDGSIRAFHYAANEGGNRARNLRDYCVTLSRNRSIMIRRHSHWYQYPSCFLVSMRLIVAYALADRNLGTFAAGFRAAFTGWRVGGGAMSVTDFCVKPPA